MATDRKDDETQPLLKQKIPSETVLRLREDFALAAARLKAEDQPAPLYSPSPK